MYCIIAPSWLPLPLPALGGGKKGVSSGILMLGKPKENPSLAPKLFGCNSSHSSSWAMEMMQV